LEKILIVEDSRVVSSYLERKIHSKMTDVSTQVVASFSELKELFDHDKDFSIALVDINLPDVKDLSLIEYLLDTNIPTLVMTATFNENLYAELKNKKIIDFVLKDSMASLEYIVTLTKRILNNKNKTVLVVDDSQTSLMQIKSYLKRHLYKVVLEKDAQEAIKKIKSDNIEIVVVDYYMPSMNGTELIQRLRKYYSIDELEIMGVSGDEKSAIHFLKFGANDFIKKPFEKEEFLHRVNNLAQHIDHIEYLKNIVNTDFLTQIYNRKYFFEEGEKYYKLAKKENRPFCLGMIDIDNFKSINDNYGHDVGDIVIKTIADILKKNTKGNDIVARFGGEEFVVVLKDISYENAIKVFKNICKNIQTHDIYLDKEDSINVTVSIGITNEPDKSLSDMLKTADERLYIAKKTGKNKVVYHDESVKEEHLETV